LDELLLAKTLTSTEESRMA